MGRDFADGQWYAIRRLARDTVQVTSLGTLAVIGLRLMGFTLTMLEGILVTVVGGLILAGILFLMRLVITRYWPALWGRLTAYTQRRKVGSLVAFIVVGVLVGGLLGAGAWALLRHDSPPPPQRVPPLVIDYDPAKPPTDFPDRGALVVLQLMPTGGSDGPVFGWNRTADGKAAKDAIRHGRPDDMMAWYVAKVRNTTGAVLVETHLTYHAAFFPQAPNQGPPVAQRDFSVDIPILEPHDTFTFYLANGSDSAITVSPPRAASAKIGSEDQPRQVAVIRSQDSMWGADLPLMFLRPPRPQPPAKPLP